MTTTQDLSVLDQPLEGRGDAVDDVLADGGRRRPTRTTVVLGMLTLLAVGVLGGVLLRGVVGTSDAGTTAAVAGGMPGGTGGTGDLTGGSFPGEDAGDASSGTVTAVGAADLTVQLDDGSSVTVTLTDTTTVTASATGSTTPAIEVGDAVTVVGTDADGTIAATSISEGNTAGPGAGGAPQQDQPGTGG